MKVIHEEDIALLVDLYELTMAQAYFQYKRDSIATFDLFIRRLPKNRSYFIAAGLDDALEYIKNLKFFPRALDYLRTQNLFSEEFLDYLSNFRFSGEIWALPEGTVFFPNEPALRVTAPIIEAQILESFLLNTMNLQITIATKASRVALAARGKGVYDFSLRRTQGQDAALKVARASYLAGFRGSSNVLAGLLYDIPIVGTMAHSFVMSFDSELESFFAFAQAFPHKSILLVDTYNTLAGLENAITVAKKMLQEGKDLKGLRLDSGDIARLSKLVRKKLDKEGLKRVKIFASGDLDEYKIEKLIKAEAKVDDFGVGTHMGVSSDAPYCDIIYKISSLRDSQGRFLPTMKLSQGKVTYPGRKQIFRRLDKKGNFKEDILGLENESIGGQPLLVKVVEAGKVIYNSPDLKEIRGFALENLKRLPVRFKRLRGSGEYPVKISPGLKKLTERLICDLKKRSKR
jgi:nicotinate phosphoribosyltransferase